MTAGQECSWHLWTPLPNQGGTSAKPQSELLVHREQAGGSVTHQPSSTCLLSPVFLVKMADLCIPMGSWDDS